MFPLEIVEEVGSTNAALRARAEAGGAEAALLARRQTAGRGQFGRDWEAPHGNLSLSVLLRPPVAALPGRHPGHWALLCGVALAEAVAGFHPPGRLGLKWPNDLLLDGRKLGGILIEAGDGWLVAGFGVNLRSAPPLSPLPACLGPGAPAAEALAGAVLAQLGHWRNRLQDEGFGPVRAAWLRHGPPVGSPVRSSRGEGLFAGLRDDGALLLTDGRAIISAG